MPTRLEWEALALVLALIAGCVGLYFYDKHEQAIGASVVTAAVADQHAKDVDVARAKEVQINAKQETADHEADRFHLAASLDARDAVNADLRLQQRFSAINARCVPGDPAASAASPTASQPDPRADAFRLVVEAARQLAADADAEHGAGLNAEQHYDALSTK